MKQKKKPSNNKMHSYRIEEKEYKRIFKAVKLDSEVFSISHFVRIAIMEELRKRGL